MTRRAHDDHDPALVEKVVASETVYEGGFLTVDHLTVELPGGGTSGRDIVRHPGAVGVLALDGDDVILVRQFRVALGRVMLEIPAGKIDHGEDPERTARRELEEETGYVAGKLAHLMTLATSAGFCDEAIDLYVTTDLTRGDSHPDTDEILEVVTMPFAELLERIDRGEIEDGKTVVAALFHACRDY